MQAANLEQEKLRRQALRQGKRRALALLLLMSALFVVAKTVLAPGFWASLLAAASEAAMVGGLADWFAVTALFRRPLGLPIPHTAVIPANKERIAAALGAFLKRHFIAPAPIAEKLDALDPAARVAQWLDKPDNARAVAGYVVRVLAQLLRSLDDREIVALLRRAVSERGERLNAAPALARMLQALADAGHHQELFDYGLQLARRELLARKDDIYQRVSDRTWRFMPSSIDRRIAEALMEGVLELLDDLGQRDHEARQRLDAMAAEFIERLQTSPEYVQKAREWVGRLLANREVHGYLDALWQELHKTLLRSAQPSEDSQLYLAGVRAVERFGTALQSDPGLRQRINRGLKAFVLDSIVPWGDEIAAFVADQVRRWDSQTLTERLELQLGPDLQFVRMSGTLVGALIGCLIFLLSEGAVALAHL